VREGGPALTGWDEFAALAPTGVQEFEVAADWKLLVEQWLEGSPRRGRFLAPNQLVEVWPGGATVLRVVPMAPGRSRLERLNFAAAVGKVGAKDGRRGAPSDAVVARGGKQPARTAKDDRTGSGGRRGDDRHGGNVQRLLDKWVAQQIELAESTQTGLAATGSELAESGPVSAALAEFRGSIAVLLPHLGGVT
jgi:hypothetical protein